MGGETPQDDPIGTRTVPDPRDSRQKLVAAAVDLVIDHYEKGTGVRDVYAYLTPGSVAARAGLSRGLIYHYWGDPEIDGTAAFSRFLSEVSDAVYGASARPEELMAATEAIPANVSDMVVLMTAFEMARLTGESSSLSRAGQVLALHGLRPNSFDLMMDQLSEVYEVVMERVGREPVPPLTARDFAIAIASTIEGFLFQDSVNPEQLAREYDWNPEVAPELTDGGWTLLAIAIEAIALRMTRPVAEDDQRRSPFDESVDTAVE